MDHWHDDTTREAFVAEAKGEANFVQTALWEITLMTAGRRRWSYRDRSILLPAAAGGTLPGRARLQWVA